MKTLITFLVLCLMALTVSCSSVYNVQYDYDTKAKFPSLETYDWLPIPAKSGINDLNMRRIKKAVDTNLEAKGLKRTSDTPDFSIAIHVGRKEKLRVTDWGYGYGHHGRYRGGYWAGGVEVYQYAEGTLILDFVDTKTKHLIWRGTADAKIDKVRSPEKREKLIDEAVQKILKNFPPPSK